MAKTIKQNIHKCIIATVLVSILYLVFIIYFEDKSIVPKLLTISIETWIVVLSLSLLNYYLRFLRWRKFISHLSVNENKINYFEHLKIYIGGFAFTLTPGKAGETVRSFYLNTYKISYESSLSAFIAERLQDVLVIIVISFLCVPILYDQNQLIATHPYIFILTVLALLLVGILLGNFFLKSDLTNNCRGRIAKFTKNIFNKTKFLFSDRIIFSTMFLGFLAWISEAFALYLIIYDLFPEFNYILFAMGVYALSVLAGTITFLPGGVGGTEVTMVFLLTLVGIDYVSALAITIVCRAATLWFAIALGAITFLFIKKYY